MDFTVLIHSSAAGVLFIYLAVESRDKAPAGDLGDGVRQKLAHF